jgi:hypothetical protein
MKQSRNKADFWRFFLYYPMNDCLSVCATSNIYVYFSLQTNTLAHADSLFSPRAWLVQERVCALVVFSWYWDEAGEASRLVADVGGFLGIVGYFWYLKFLQFCKNWAEIPSRTNDNELTVVLKSDLSDKFKL